MKKTYSLIVLALMIISQVTAQNTTTQQAIPAFNGKLVANSSQLQMASQEALNSKFLKYDVYTIDVNAITHLIEQNNTSNKKENSFAINLGEKYNWEITITPYDMRSKDYVLREGNSSGIIEHPRSATFTYKGSLTNGESNEVRLSFRNGYISGFIRDNGREISIEPLTRFDKSAPNDQFVVYQSSDLVDQQVSCETFGEEDHNQFFDQEEQPKESSINDKGQKKACQETEIALACDHTFFQAQASSVAQAEGEMIETLFLTDAMYASLDIRYKLVEIYIDLNNAITASGTTNNNTILNNFISWGPTGFTKTHDVASFWTERDICGSSCDVVGTAIIGAICNSNRYNIIEHYTTSQTMLKIDQAHELGHNWNAQHVSGTDFVMLPTLSNTNINWSNTSTNSITNHKNSRSCLSGASPCPVATTVPDFSAHTVSSCDGTVAFTDLSTGNTYRWLWNFGDGSGFVFLKHPVHTYPNGTYSVSLRVYDPNGFYIENKTSYITVSQPAGPTGTNGSRCGTGSVNLSAAGTNTIRWYDAPTGGTLLGTGSTYATPSISSTTTYYAEDADLKAAKKVGPVNSGTGGNFTSDYRRMFFDVFAPVMLKSVKVNASGSGNRTIVVYNSNNDVVHEKTVNIPNGVSRVTLDFFLSPGTDYYIKLVGNVNLFRDNAGVSYPYTSPGLLSIKSSDAGGNPLGFYYFFYDWELQESECISQRTAVQAVINVCAGVNDQNGLSNIVKIHPNPVKNLLHIDVSNVHSKITVEVFNTLGEQVLGINEPYNKKYTVDFQNHPTGIYYVKIIGDNEAFTTKVVVTR